MPIPSHLNPDPGILNGAASALPRGLTRRHLLSLGMGAGASLGMGMSMGSRLDAAETLAQKAGQKVVDDLVTSVGREVVLGGREQGAPVWYHPRACRLPDGRIFQTMQTISGSDYFGPLHLTTSADAGRTWTKPDTVPPLDWVKQPDGSHEAVCDVTPEYHAPTGTVLALGHNVYYSGPKFNTNQPPRWPVYAVWRDGVWGARRKLVWDDPRGSYIYTNNCGQRVVMPDGDVLLAFTFGVKDKPRSVCSLLATYDGEQLVIKRAGPALHNPVRRGLLEPSLTAWQGRYYLTLRAEDDRGYVSVSEDGLNWKQQQPWAWDEDGKPLHMSTTQQHWLTHGDALYLVYTRRDVSNEKVFRWRAPLWMARVNPETLRLMRSTERVILPLVGDPVGNPADVAAMGNFHTVNISPEESLVTVGEWHRESQKGELLQARIRWSRPNGLVG